jgi:hypothetical protein
MTYGCGNQHVERVATGLGAKALANAWGAAGVRASKRRCLREDGCHEYRVDQPSGDEVLLQGRLLTPRRCLTPDRLVRHGHGSERTTQTGIGSVHRLITQIPA